MLSHRFENLLADYLDGDLDDAGREELAAEVERTAAAARALDEALAMESLLVAAHVEPPGAAALRERLAGRAVAPRQGKAMHLSRRAMLVAAAVLVVVAGVAAMLLVLESGGPHEVLSGCVMVDGAAARRVKDGSRLEVAPGAEAVVRLADGSRAVLAPASVATLHGPAGNVRQRVDLEAGRAVFQVEPGPAAFKVTTPLGTVTVLGTDFSVELCSAGANGARKAAAMVVAVERGKVAVDYRGNQYELTGGESRTFGDLPADANQAKTVPPVVPPAVPAALQGFRGILRGAIVRKLDDGFWLKVERVEQAWQQSRAAAPQDAVGKEVRLRLGLDPALVEQHRQTLQPLAAGDVVLVEAFDFGDDGLTAVEELRKAD